MDGANGCGRRRRRVIQLRYDSSSSDTGLQQKKQAVTHSQGICSQSAAPVADVCRSRGRERRKRQRSNSDSSSSRSAAPVADVRSSRGRKRRKRQRSNSDSSSSQSAAPVADVRSSRGRKRRKRQRSKSDRCTSVTVGTVTNNNGKRVRDKKLICFICKQKVLWLSRHLSKSHSTNFLVAQVLAKSGKEQQMGWKRLKNLGSFKHNTRVLRKQKGELIVVRRSANPRNYESYLPCNKCFGFYYKYDLWRHVCPCKQSTEEKHQLENGKDVIDSSRSLLEGAVNGEENGVDKVLRKEILQKMRYDEKLKVIKSDTLILRFGTAQLKRIGVKGRRRISARMRLLARLLSVLKKKTDMPNKSLYHFLSGRFFDTVLESVEDLCELRYDSKGQRSFNKPSLALTVGNALIKCCCIKKGMAIRSSDDKAIKDSERFHDLYKSDYSDHLSCPALSTLKTSKYNKAEELPTTEDLVKLKNFTEQQMETLSQEVRRNPAYKTWKNLAEMVLTRLIVFNKRRASEPAKLELKQYLERPDWKSTSNKEVLGILKPIEQELMKRMDLVQVPGKRNRKVPILITPDVTKAMQALLATRKHSGIPPVNPYFFATASRDGHLNTWAVLHETAVAAGVSQPKFISSTRLRKYVATIAQVCNMYCTYVLRVEFNFCHSEAQMTELPIK